MTGLLHEIEDLIVPVSIHNVKALAEAITAQPVQIVEPGHFAMITFVLVAGAGPVQILGEDPNREDALIQSADAAVILCHTQAQAGRPNNTVAGTPAPDGFYLAQGVGVTLTGTGALWINGPTGTRVSVAINRRH
jgi:hypothetical protein